MYIHTWSDATPRGEWLLGLDINFCIFPFIVKLLWSKYLFRAMDARHKRKQFLEVYCRALLLLLWSIFYAQVNVEM